MKINTKINEVIEVNSDECYVKGIGGYDGTNAGSSGVQPIQSVISGLSMISGTGVSAIVALTESEYAALEAKDSTTLYIVTPDPPPVTNYLRLSGDAMASGTITEVGSGYDISDLTNNPPVLYDGNGDVVSVSQWRTERDPFGEKLKYRTTGSWIYITTAAAPQTYGYS